MNFIGIVGTNASYSQNRKLLQFMQKHFKDQATITLFEIKDVPAFKTNEGKKSPAIIQTLADQITASDGVIISTPEYDHTIPAALKSVLEWLSYGIHPLVNCPVLVIGASYGRLGSSRAQFHLRQILSDPDLGARVMSGDEFLLSRAGQAFDDEGNLKDEENIRKLEASVTSFIAFAKNVNQVYSRTSSN